MAIFITGVYALDDGLIESASEYDYPPFCIVKEDGEADGFSVELLRASLAAMDYEVSFYTGPWAEVKQDLADGKIQVLPLVGRTPEREAIYDFTEPYITFFGAIFVRKGDTRIKTVEDLADKEVLVMKGDNAEEYVRREAVSENIIATESYDEAFRLLSEGQNDAIIAHNLVGNQIIKKLGIRNVVQVDHRIDKFRQDFTFAVKEGDSELLGILDKGLAIVIEDGTFDRLHEKWFEEVSGEAPLNNMWVFGIIALVMVLVIILYLKKKR